MKKWIISFLVLCCISISAQPIAQLETVLEYPFSQVSRVDIERLQAKIAVQEKNNGLRFQSGITSNDYIGFEEGSSWRISAGLQFNIFEDGIYDRNNTIKALKLDKQLREIDLQNQQKDKNYAYVYNYMIYVFNTSKRNILRQKKYLLNSLINKNYNLYYNHELNYDEILYLQGLNDEAELLLKSMIHIDKIFESIVNIEEIPKLDADALPVLEFNIDSIISYDPFAYLTEITDLKKSRAQHLESVRNSQRLSLYFNLHARPGVNDQNGPIYNSFGVRYSTPLNFDKKEREELLNLEQQRVDVFQDDVIFNHNKELINLVLDYNSKLRQYSNFIFKLKKIQEQKRVQTAVQQVSTLNVKSKRDWKIDLEILNVRYELIELKQLLYLSLMRIYNKAKLNEIQPFVKQKTFDESQNRFQGNRVIKITESNAYLYENDFVINYLEKNNFQFVLWLGQSDMPKTLQHEFYSAGISIVSDVANFEHAGVIQVPVKQFLTRGDMELWIKEQLKIHSKGYLFFENIENLLLLDSKTIGD